MTRRPAPSDLLFRTLRFRPVVMHMSIRTLALALAGLTLTACAKRSAERTMAPAEDSAADAQAGDIDALEAELAAREDELRALGAGPSGGAEALARRDAQATAEGDDAEAKPADAPTASGRAAPTMGRSAATKRSEQPDSRCERVCEITAAICQLRDNICGLAPSHPDEPRYQRACDRATVDCTTATEACDACA